MGAFAAQQCNPSVHHQFYVGAKIQLKRILPGNKGMDDSQMLIPRVYLSKFPLGIVDEKNAPRLLARNHDDTCK